VAKHLRYSEVKHPDKFAEALAAIWGRCERFALPAGIAMAVGLAAIILWLVGTRLFAGRGDAAWHERFELAQEAAAAARDSGQGVTDELLAKMADFVRRHPRHPAGAVTLLELAQGHMRRAAMLRAEKPDEAKAHLEKAASAGEQFVADFPDHRYVALAHYEAGKARFDLGQWERAAEHFEKASASQVPTLAALAKWQAAICYEKLGRIEPARLKYEELRVDPLAGWCAEQAEFALAQLGRRPAEPKQRESGTPAPRPASPAPSK